MKNILKFLKNTMCSFLKKIKYRIFFKKEHTDLKYKKKANIFKNISLEKIIKKIHQSHISNCIKNNLIYHIKNSDHIHTLIINSTEYGLYLTSDNFLMKKHLEEILDGIFILISLLKLNLVCIVIEFNQFKKLNILKNFLNKKNIKIYFHILKTKYYIYNNIELIKLVIGKSVSETGILIYNVNTIYEIKQAIINFESINSRVITFFNNNHSLPYYVVCKFGTTIKNILLNLNLTFHKKIILLDPYEKKYLLADISMPILNTTRSVFVPTVQKNIVDNEEQPCIRCNLCANSCPVYLYPQELYRFILENSHKKTKIYGIECCIECEICSYICPSNIPLVQYFRQEKEKIKIFEKQKSFSKQSKINFERRQSRLNNQNKNILEKSTYKLKMEAAIIRARNKKINNTLLHNNLNKNF